MSGTEYILYRFFSRSGSLLYVGITINPAARFKDHRSASQFWPHAAAITLERFPTYEELAAAEIRAIENESPEYNKANALPREETSKRNINATNIFPDASRFCTDPSKIQQPKPERLQIRQFGSCPYCGHTVVRYTSEEGLEPVTDPECIGCSKTWSVGRWNYIQGLTPREPAD